MFLLTFLLCLPCAIFSVFARAVNVDDISSSEEIEEAQLLQESDTEQVQAIARSTEENVIQPGATSGENAIQKENTNSFWSEELHAALTLACEWLTISKQGKLYYLCLGTAGAPAPAQLVTKYISDVSLTKKYEEFIDLEYAILNTTFCGYNSQNVLGKNLIKPIEDYPDFRKCDLKTVAYAILALDCNQYKLSKKSINTHETLIDQLLRFQNNDGGFSLKIKHSSTPTQTALALVVLADYQKKDSKCERAVQKAISYLSLNQHYDGMFYEKGQPSSVAISKVITALLTLNISLDDERFIKAGETLDKLLMNFASVDGGFSESLNGESDVLATENAILALSAIEKGRNPYQLMFHLDEIETEKSEETSATTGVSKSIEEKPITVLLLAGSTLLILFAALISNKIFHKK